ncbi:MAG: G8 domain-containing protein [Planctomycetota bacterium]
MPHAWINRLVGRNQKLVKRGKLRSRQMKRRLLLQGLETRQLLAGDMMATSVAEGEMAGAGEMSSTSSMSGHGDHSQGHPAAMALVSLDQATHTVTTSGNWSDPLIWEGQALPTEGARIVIPHGVTLTVDSQLTPEFKTIRVDGVLDFATNVNTELRVDTIVSSPMGRFRMGTAANPIQADVTARVVFADDGAIDTTWDPEQLSRGAILQGPTEVHGAAKTHRLTLAAFPVAGDTSIQLNSVPDGWSTGDEVVITGTQGATSDEVRTIDSIDGTTVNFGTPLELDHVPPKGDLNLYVANKTRNAQFSSENTETSRRGHIMVMHTLDADIQNAELDQLGRTDKNRELDDLIFDFPEVVGNQTSAPVVYNVTPGERTNVRGRYPLHFHRGGVDPTSTPATVVGNVVDVSPGWGFVNHSGNVNMVNNVAYGVQGASFYTEVGDEIGSMVGNIAIRSVSPSFTLDDSGAIDPDLRLESMDFGVDGDGYWLSGHMVSMRDNVSAGATGHGIIIWSDGVIEPDLERGRSSVKVANVANGNLITGRDTIPTWWAPLAEISNNESYGATIGFRSRYVHSAGYLGEIGSPFHTPPDQVYIDTLSPTIDGLTVWGSRDGMLMNYNERMSIKNARLVGIGAPYVANGGTADTGVGIDMYNEVTRGPGVIENVSVEGFNMGILAPRQDNWRLDNINLSNTTDMFITEARQGPRVLDMTNVTFGSLDGTAVQDQAAQRQNIVMATDFEADAHQPFFFLMSDVVTLDGQQLYFDAQAAEFTPITQQIEHPAVRLPQEMIGATNQQLNDRYGTSFAGAITPSDAVSVDYLTGGVVGAVAPPPATSPPLYDMASEGEGGVLVDPGTLTNFSGGLPPGDDDGGDGDDDGGDGDDDGGDGDDGDPGDDNDDDDCGDHDEDSGDDSDEDDESGDGDDEDGDGEGDPGDEDDDTDGDDGDSNEDDESGDGNDEDSDDDGDVGPGDEEDDTDGGDSEEDDDESGNGDDEDSDDDGEGDPGDEEDDDTDGGEDDSDEDGDDEDATGDGGDEDDETGNHCDGQGDDEDDDADGGDTDEDDDSDGEGDDTDGDDEDSDDDTDGGDTDEDDDSDGEGDDTDGDDEDSDEGDDSDGEGDDEDGSDSRSFQNSQQPTDVNNDGSTSPVDALLVINTIGQSGTGLLSQVATILLNYIDVNGDGALSAIDALRVINFLSQPGLAGAEAESVTPSSPLSFDQAIVGGLEDDDEQVDEQTLDALALRL